MTGNYIFDCGTSHESVATEEEFDRITEDIHMNLKRMEDKFSIHTRYYVA
jgi:DNA repair photolyase